MKTTTCAMMFGSLLLLVAGNCLAAETTANKPLTARDEQVAELGVNKQNEQLRAWVDSIKPAAGHVEPVHQGPGYWERSVRRDTQRHMQE